MHEIKAMLTVAPAIAVPFVQSITKGRLVTVVMAFAFGTMIEVAAQTQKKVEMQLNTGSTCWEMQNLSQGGCSRLCGIPRL